jgi:hypothetical protein
MKYEALSDYLARLAAANGYSTGELRALLRQSGHVHSDVIKNALNCQLLPPFSAPALPGLNIQVVDYGLRASDFTRLLPRWCPLCVEESPWLRPHWRIKVVTICHHHSIHLLQMCAECQSTPSLSEVLAGRCQCGCQFTRTVKFIVNAATHLCKLLSKSLHMQVAFTDSGTPIPMTTRQIVRMILYVGKFIHAPNLHKPGQVSELEKIGIAADLYEGTVALLINWPNAYWDCLERCLQNAQNETSIRGVFGPLYHTIYHHLNEPEFQFLRDAFERFLIARWRGHICGRHRLFRKETIAEYPRKSVSAIARSQGLSFERVKSLANMNTVPAYRLRSGSERQYITIDLSNLHKFIPTSAEFVDLRTTARLLGLNRPRVYQMVANGLLLEGVDVDWQTSTRWQFKRSDVLHLMNRIRGANRIKRTSEGSVVLNHVLRYWGINGDEFCKLVKDTIDGKLSCALREGEQLRDVTFHESELRTWLERLRESADSPVSVQQAAKMLGLKEEVVCRLAEKNILHTVVRKCGQRKFRQIARDSLRRFNEDYVSLAELASKEGTSPRALLGRIAAIPITGPSIDGGRKYFFRRRDVETILCVNKKFRRREN